MYVGWYIIELAASMVVAVVSRSGAPLYTTLLAVSQNNSQTVHVAYLQLDKICPNDHMCDPNCPRQAIAVVDQCQALSRPPPTLLQHKHCAMQHPATHSLALLQLFPTHCTRCAILCRKAQPRPRWCSESSTCTTRHWMRNTLRSTSSSPAMTQAKRSPNSCGDTSKDSAAPRHTLWYARISKCLVFPYRLAAHAPISCTLRCTRMHPCANPPPCVGQAPNPRSSFSTFAAPVPLNSTAPQRASTCTQCHVWNSQYLLITMHHGNGQGSLC